MNREPKEKHYFKCMKCRTRHVFRHPVEWYKIKRKCRSCGHWRFYLDKERTNRNDYCTCGTTHYPHRYKSSLCMHHPDYQMIVRTQVYGEERIEVMIDMAFNSPQQPEDFLTSEEVPF